MKTFFCIHCGQQVVLPDDFSGRQAFCSHCGEQNVSPESQEPPAERQEPPAKSQYPPAERREPSAVPPAASGGEAEISAPVRGEGSSVTTHPSPTLVFRREVIRPRRLAYAVFFCSALLIVATLSFMLLDLAKFHLLSMLGRGVLTNIFFGVQAACWVLAVADLLAVLAWIFQVHLDMPALTGRGYDVAPLEADLKLILPVYAVWGMVSIFWNILDQLENFAREARVRCPGVAWGRSFALVNFLVMIFFHLLAVVFLFFWASSSEAKMPEWLSAPSVLVPPFVLLLISIMVQSSVIYRGILRRIRYLEDHRA